MVLPKVQGEDRGGVLEEVEDLTAVPEVCARVAEIDVSNLEVALNDTTEEELCLVLFWSRKKKSSV